MNSYQYQVVEVLDEGVGNYNYPFINLDKLKNNILSLPLLLNLFV